MAKEMTWDEGNRLVAALGSEANLAKRIAYEREQRQWSQAELARRMREVDCPIPQTAISKIESPAMPGARRDVTVDEAIALAKVFDVPLAELFLPQGEVELLRARSLLRDAAKARLEYSKIVAELARRALDNQSVRDVLDEIRDGRLVSIPSSTVPADRSGDLKNVLQDVANEVNFREKAREAPRARPRSRPGRAQ